MSWITPITWVNGALTASTMNAEVRDHLAWLYGAVHDQLGVTSDAAPSNLGRGTTFPGSPATNDLLFRTDLGEWYYYDGTQWLSTAIHYVPLTASYIQAVADGSTTTATIGKSQCGVMTALPAVGVVAVSVFVQMGQSIANSGNAVSIYNYGDSSDIPMATAPGFPTAGYWSMATAVVAVANRQFDYTISCVSGTVTYYLRVSGYWAHVIAT